MKTGLRTPAYVYLVRPDGKLDLRLAQEGFEKYDEATEKLWAYLADNKFLFLTDKSAPEEINALMGMSKKTFKQAVGKLYKDRKIMLFDDKIARVDG
jgi:predicted RNA-binding protein (virulence factor B family)